jgi:hypothetical protein
MSRNPATSTPPGPPQRQGVTPFAHTEVRDLATDYCVFRGYFALDRETARDLIDMLERRMLRQMRRWPPRELRESVDQWFST